MEISNKSIPLWADIRDVIRRLIRHKRMIFELLFAGRTHRIVMNTHNDIRAVIRFIQAHSWKNEGIKLNST